MKTLKISSLGVTLCLNETTRRLSADDAEGFDRWPARLLGTTFEGVSVMFDELAERRAAADADQLDVAQDAQDAARFRAMMNAIVLAKGDASFEQRLEVFIDQVSDEIQSGVPNDQITIEMAIKLVDRCVEFVNAELQARGELPR